MAKLKTIIRSLTKSLAALSLLTGGMTVFALTTATPAMAQASNAKAKVDAAISRGDVGEQIDGYLGIVDGASPSADVRAAVSEINIARKAVYTDAARANGTQTAVFAQLTGEKQVKKAASGTYIKDATGQWKRK